MSTSIQFTDKLKNNLLGQTFARLTVIAYAGQNKHTAHLWTCQCECGNTHTAKASNLRTGHTKSCGCIPTGTKKHGHTWRGGVSSEYLAWKNLRARCIDEKNRNYRWYGAKGIKVCDRWLNSFENFLCDMGSKPSSKHSIERKDVHGNYEPDNCIWATREEQDRNRGNNVFVEIEGEKKTVSEWCREKAIPTATIFARIKRGWTPEKVVNTPIAHKKNTKCPPARPAITAN
jgi:hypothetical protein